MERSPTLGAFRADPIGRYLAGRCWAHFAAAADLFGVLLFGRPALDDINALIASLRIELGPGVGPHRSLVDASRVDGADAAAFALLAEYVRAEAAALADRVTRLALVRPGGLPGAVVAGFYNVAGAPYPVAIFDELAPALGWLGAPDRLAEDLAGVHAALTGTDPLLGALHALLREDLVAAELVPTARRLGVSSRTLQRRLQTLGTSFQAELGAVRLAEAQRLMQDSDAPLTTIAIDTGHSSLQHFSAVFRRATGQTPSAWRGQRRRGPAG